MPDMFLRAIQRKKNGKVHRYFSVAENRRLSNGKVAQRQLLHLGEINDSQETAWRKTLSVFDETRAENSEVSLFPDDRPLPPGALNAVRVIVSEMQLKRPRCFGNCWLGCELWSQLNLDAFWSERLKKERGEVPWEKVLQLLTVNRLIDPGSEFRLHRQWFDRSAMDQLLDVDFACASKDRLYRCLDRVLPHKDELFKHLRQRWEDLFCSGFEVLLYDLTSTYFEGLCESIPKAKHGYSRDGRPDCRQVVIALVITPDGLPLAYEVMPGNTSDKTTLKDFLKKIEERYGKAKRTWLMDRGIPTEETLEQMRKEDTQYLVGTPKGKLSALEKEFLALPWKERVEAHIFVAFLAYCLIATLRKRLEVHAPGLTPKAVLEKLATLQMLDVWLPTTDGRWLVLPRYTQPEKDQQIVLDLLKLTLPAQPPPRIRAAAATP